MTTNEIVAKVYIMLEKKYHMSVVERCELQKLLKEATLRDIQDADKENFIFHINKFEEDIFNIVSNTKEKCLTKIVQMQIALDRVADEINGI